MRVTPSNGDADARPDALLWDPTVLQAIRAGVMVSTVGGQRTYAYVGRAVPKGWREMAGAIHLGRGEWLFRVEPLAPASEPRSGEATP